MQKQVWFPSFIQRTDEVSDERHVIRPHGLSAEGHHRFFRCAIPFLVVASDTCANEVFPRVFTSAGNRNDMVDGQREIRATAEQAPMTVAPEDVLTRKNDLLKWNPDIEREPYDAGKRHGGRRRPNSQCLVGLDELHLPKIKKYDCFPHVDHTHGLIVLIKNQNLRIQLPVRHVRVNLRAEVLLTSFCLNTERIAVRKTCKNIAFQAAIVKLCKRWM